MSGDKQNPAYLRELRAACENFLTELRHLMGLYSINRERIGSGYLPAASPLADADPIEIAKRTAAVSRAAGRAAEATRITGTAFRVQGPKARSQWIPLGRGTRSHNQSQCSNSTMSSPQASR